MMNCFSRKTGNETYFLLKRGSLSEARAFGLDRVRLKIEKIPSIIRSAQGTSLKRLDVNQPPVVKTN